MANRRTHDVVATVGTYKSNGEEKKRYSTVGSAFTDDQGRISIKLDTVPVSPDWSGWLSLYPAKERDSQERPARQQSTQRRQDPPPAMEDDDIPF